MEHIPTTFESPESDEEPEPRPLDAEAIDRQVKTIWQLWAKRRDPNDAFDRTILEAYTELELLCGEIRNKADAERLEQINPDVLFELQFAKNNLGRIIKRPYAETTSDTLQSPLEDDTI